MTKQKPIETWAQIFGVEICDNDGFLMKNSNGQWARRDLTETVTLGEFLKGIVECTIRPTSVAKYQVLRELM